MISSKQGQFHHLYNTVRWRSLRSAQLSREPLCRMCFNQGIVREANICDHIEQHHGDELKFYRGPFQSLCKHCHDSHKQRLEKSGDVMGCDEKGYPLDPEHHWK